MCEVIVKVELVCDVGVDFIMVMLLMGYVGLYMVDNDLICDYYCVIVDVFELLIVIYDVMLLFDFDVEFVGDFVWDILEVVGIKVSSMFGNLMYYF